jgi:hypothetical protein
MTSHSGKPKSRNRFRLLLLCVFLLILTEAARRILTGHGTLHEWARGLLHDYKAARYESARSALGLPEQAETPLIIYGDALTAEWMDWSWARHDLRSTGNILRGRYAISMTPEAFKGLYLHHAPLGTAGYGTLQFFVFGTADIKVSVADADGKFGKPVSLGSYRRAASNLLPGWSVVRIPLTELGLSHLGATISGIVFQSATATLQSDLFLDDMSLLPDPSLPIAAMEATVGVRVDATVGRHPISPFIYGMAFAPSDYLADLRLGSNRWGGNDKSRYNWVHGDATNAARDWRWANRAAAYGGKFCKPSSAADAFFADNRATGTATVLTVPTLGWVARDSDNAHMSQHVPTAGGSPLQTVDGAIRGYDPADNRKQTSIRSFAHKPGPFTNDPNSDEGAVYQDEWVHHLVNSFGDAAHGGVPFYAMDNEPDLWDSTHTDVHPARMGYDDMLANFLEYATAVKNVDPHSQVTGPVSSGWTAYLYSSLDRGDDRFHTHADRARHGNEEFLPWFLKQVHAHDLRSHSRTLDVLDVHYYPQGSGLYDGRMDQDAQTRRLRATRSLWDADYSDESWIGEPVRLIPRLKSWIGEDYPGTKIGITEWNFGADKEINGALAIADVLGIFGREDVYLANYWAYPQKNSPGYLAFRLYRNADGHGHGFGDLACSAVSANFNQVSCFAAVDTTTGELTLMLINKMHKATVTTPITFKGREAVGSTAQMWLLSSRQPHTLVPQMCPPGQKASMSIALPPSSITLLRLK